MNPVDHPHGGGEGRTAAGRHPVSPWGQHTKGKRTRSEADQDLVASFDRPARFHRPDDRCAQRPSTRAGVRDGKHGRPQAG